MINFTKKQVLKSKVEINPFPYFVVKNLLPKSDLKKLNQVLPSFNEIADKESLFQSKSETKKTIFLNKNDLKVQKKYKVKDNFCLFTLNTPWSYHSALEYRGNKDRKYFYVAYDFPISKLSSIEKNRKKGLNLNLFWKDDVLIKSQTRKKYFFSE